MFFHEKNKSYTEAPFMRKLLSIEIFRVFGWVVFLVAFAFAPSVALAQYAINGNATQISCNCYRLTPDANSQSGSVWNLNQINLHNSFDFIFDVYFGTNDGGADGIGFVLQPISTTVGGGGGGMGFAGISPSWAVEMDTYQNTNDPGVDHIAIIRNGDVNHGSPNTLVGPVQMSATSGNVEDGAWHQLRVVWDPNFTSVLVYFDGQLRLTQNYDMITNIFGGNSNVYWGFTAGTGGARNEHRFCVGIVPQFNSSTANACAGTPIQFTDNSISTLGPIASWNWTFGDGNSSNLQNPTHTYTTGGIYTVDLTVTDINGCTASSNYQITITAPANASAGVDVSICDGDAANLLGSGGTTYSWSPATGLSDPNIANPVATPALTTTYTLTVTDANGCQGTDDIQVTVNPLPTAAFDATTECLGTATQFSDQSTSTFGTIATHAWDFGDNNSSALQDPNHTYGLEGNYNVTLTVTATGGCTNSTTEVVTVYPQPVADFTFTDECLDTPNSFQDQSAISSGTINSWAWDFNNGESSSTAQNPNYAFATDGLKNVDLAVTSADGCSASQSYQVEVFPLPQAMFSAPDLCLGATTDFTDLSQVSSGTITNWDWDFDDNNFSTLTSPSHTYANADQYDVTLLVTTDRSCVSSVTLPVIISTNPVAGFTFVEACETDDVVFTSTSSISVGNIDIWAWDFGDSNSSGTEHPSHSYSTYGTYTVGLTVTSPEGCSDFIEQDVNVHPYPIADFTVTTECFGTPTQFTDGSSVSGDIISTWAWDFGDNSSPSSSQNPTNQYVQEGQFTAILTVTTPNSCSATVSYPVTVHAMPVAEFDNTTVCAENPTDFENLTQLSSGTLVSVNWDFGDGNSGSGDNPSNLYADYGVYVATMTVTSDEGCIDQISHEVQVYPLPEVDFTSDVISGCQPLNVQFVDLSTIPGSSVIASRVWDIGVGDPISSTAPNYTYIQQGSYDVTLTVTSLEGCTSVLTLADAITVFPKPKAAFSFGPQPTTLFDPVIEFTDESSGATEWAWSFGDDIISSQQDPEHEYLDSGTYVVELIAINDFDCTDTIEDIVVIDPVITLFIPEAFTPNSDGVNDKFFARGTGITKFKMSIFNRWGQQVFTTWDIDNGWNGTLNNSGLEVKQDIYTYKIILEDISGREKAYKGIVTLLR